MKKLNYFEVMTLYEAYKRHAAGTPDRIHIPAHYSDCKNNLPVLINSGLINKDCLKFAGMIVLTNKGIKAGAKLYSAV
jgi:hypothetical protein